MRTVCVKDCPMNTKISGELNCRPNKLVDSCEYYRDENGNPDVDYDFLIYPTKVCNLMFFKLILLKSFSTYVYLLMKKKEN